MPVDVTTSVFEGPFDLLLHLIVRDQIDIYEVSLTTIVDAYLTELERIQTLDLDLATEFLLIAATLVELKARRLLPGRDDIDIDEEFALWEERDLLLARLLECKTFKDVASVFARLADDAGRSVARSVGPDERFTALAPDPLDGMAPATLRHAFLRVSRPRPLPVVDISHVAPIRISVADAVAELVDELPRTGTITFRRLTSASLTRLEVIVRFLAVLELFKQGMVDVVQRDRFGDIEIEWRGDDLGGLTDRDAVLAVDVYEG